MDSVPEPSVRVILKPRRAQPFYLHHPWVFDSAISQIEGDPAPGDMVTLCTPDRQFVAWGLFNPHSRIRVRLYSWKQEEIPDSKLIAHRIDQACQTRLTMFGPTLPHTAERLIFSEADGLSGLTVDRYGNWLCVQFTSLALWNRRDSILSQLQQRYSPRGIVLRTEKGIRAAEGLEISDGLLAGEMPSEPIVIVDGAVKYAVDLSSGQKTGFFLDQRDNRRLLNPFVSGQSVLDLFCYSGGFGLTALVEGKAAHVTAVDVSAAALDLVQTNARLNGVADQITTRKSDGFKALEEFALVGRRFPAVILDPPKMARNRDALDAAIRGYISLNQLGMQTVEPEGWLVTCSCTGLLTAEMFLEVLSRAAVQAGRQVQVVSFQGAGIDHPTSVHCPETNYLKCALCRII